MQTVENQLPLTILSAVYGKADVTNKVRSLISQNSVSVRADNAVFGDPWYGVQKSLVIVYQYGSFKPEVIAVREGQNLKITSQNYKHQGWYLAPKGTMTILGAAYGLANVTDAVAAKLHDNCLDVTADNNSLGDGWYGVRKTLTVTYLNTKGIPVTATVEEGGQLKIIVEQQQQTPGQTSQGWDRPHLNILSAVYGKKNVTDQLRSQASQDTVTVRASNDVFGDPWYGVRKSLVVIYQYGFFKPEVAIVQEDDMITISPQSYTYQQWYLPIQGQFALLGAAYGLSDVTEAVSSKVKGNCLNIRADNSNLGDSWPGVRKTFVVAAINHYGLPATVICEEGEQLKLDQHMQDTEK